MVSLKRLYHSATETIGALCINDLPVCWTLENPWANNKRAKSCIPIGHYRLVRFASPRLKIDTFKVYDLQLREVAGRDGIIIHAGNTADDTDGCILLGCDVGMLKGQHAVLQSQTAFARFMDEMSVINDTDFFIS